MTTFPSTTYASSDVSDTGMVPRGLCVFSLATDRPEITIPNSVRTIPAAAIQQPNGSAPRADDGAADGDQRARAAGGRRPQSGAQPMQEEVEGDAKAERIAILREQIALVIGAQRHAAMTASDIGKLANLQRLKVLRTSVLLGAVRHCRRNPMADSRLAILAFITFLSDNKLGMSRLSVRRIGRILGRSDQAIVTSIASLEKDGQIGVLRRQGAGSYYWPLIPAQLTAADPHIVWLIDAIDHYDQTAQGGLTAQGALSGSTAQVDLSSQAKPLKSSTYNRSSRLESISLKRSQQEKDSLGADAPGACATEEHRFSGGAPDQGRAPPERAPTSTRGTDCKPPTDAEIEVGFHEWYKAYPRKKKPDDARRAYVKRVKARRAEDRATIPQLLAAVKAYEFRTDINYVPYPASWLNGGEWRSSAASVDIPASQDFEPYWYRDNPATCRAIGAAGWGFLIKQHAANGTWNEKMLGPHPSDPGCVIPRDTLRDLSDLFTKLSLASR